MSKERDEEAIPPAGLALARNPTGVKTEPNLSHEDKYGTSGGGERRGKGRQKFSVASKGAEEAATDPTEKAAMSLATTAGSKTQRVIRTILEKTEASSSSPSSSSASPAIRSAETLKDVLSLDDLSKGTRTLPLRPRRPKKRTSDQAYDGTIRCRPTFIRTVHAISLLMQVLCSVAGLITNSVVKRRTITTYSRDILFFAFPTTLVISGGYLVFRSTTVPAYIRKTWPGEIWVEVVYVALWFTLYIVAVGLSGSLGFTETFALLILASYIVTLLYIFVHYKAGTLADHRKFDEPETMLMDVNETPSRWLRRKQRLKERWVEEQRRQLEKEVKAEREKMKQSPPVVSPADRREKQ